MACFNVLFSKFQNIEHRFVSHHHILNFCVFFGMRSLLFICFLSVVLCACPNNCNGHGKCNSGVCECFGSVGLETVKKSDGQDYNVDSYYGPDCSRSIDIILIFLRNVSNGYYICFNWRNRI